MADLENAKAYLQKDNGGISLFDHMADVLLKVLNERPEDPVAKFEQLSASVKSNRFLYGSKTNQMIDRDAVEAHCKLIRQLHKRAEDDEEIVSGEAEAQEPLPAPKAEVVADLAEQNQLLEAAGAKIADEDLFKLNLSLARLAGANSSIASLKLWGKIIGTNNSYYIAEGTGADPIIDEDETKEDPETEANINVYWVCNYPGGSWVQLPSVRPSEINGARMLRRFFTGDLEVDVAGYPKFPGKEASFLRATIAIINQDCAISPAGFYIKNDENTEFNANEEFQYASASELASAGKWEVYGMELNSLGRVTPLQSQDEEGNDVSLPEGFERRVLRETSEEEWIVRTYPQTLPASQSSCAVLRSAKWPGAVAVANRKSWTNFYVGYGYQKLSEPYVPPMPPALQTDDSVSLQEQDDVVEPPAAATEETE